MLVEADRFIEADLGAEWDVLSACQVPPSLEVFIQEWRDALQRQPGITAETVARRIRATYVQKPQDWDLPKEDE